MVPSSIRSFGGFWGLRAARSRTMPNNRCESCDSAARWALVAVSVIHSNFSLRSASLRRGARKKIRA
eukprot:11439062-Alexandrium_andersonii.AAC.2